MVNEAQACHHTYPGYSALGRTLTIALVLGAMLKGDESVTAGSGILNGIVAVADSKDMCGLCWQSQPSAIDGRNKLAVGEAVGRGLFVMRDLGLKGRTRDRFPFDW